MNHERRRFVPKVRYITSPGFGDGGEWRKRQNLAGGGPSRGITSMGIFAFDAGSREMTLQSHHPGISIDEVRQQTGWPLAISPDVTATPAPSDDELAAVRKYDPKGIWTS